ncbi:MAG: YncE family protein, partial [Candidatus Acidiferrales bacterium]
VDRNERKIVATWKLGDAQDNFPMALNEKDKRLFVGCRTPGEVLILDTGSGEVVGRVPSVSHADDMWYDAGNKRVYVSGGGGFITVVGQQDANHYRRIAQIKTLPGARTSCLVPQLKRLYLGVWSSGAQPEELQVYEVLR